MAKGPMQREIELLAASEDLRFALKRAFKLAEETAREIVADVESEKDREFFYRQAINYYMWELMHHLFLVSRQARKIKDSDTFAYEKG